LNSTPITKEELVAAARVAAARHGLNPALVCAVVEQESAWNQWATRYEAAFRIRYVAPLGLPLSEEVSRSTSWGLMQVMGQVAREAGFHGTFLSQLCDPEIGLEWGCTVLAKKLAQGGDPEKGLQLWNGGANLQYAAQVLARTSQYQAA
jgi:soluble lytic murein transglycosylase-like protein